MREARAAPRSGAAPGSWRAFIALGIGPIALVSLLMSLAILPATAAEPQADALAGVIDQARAAGARVIIIDEPAPDATPPVPAEGAGQRAAQVIGRLLDRIEEVAALAPDQLAGLGSTLTDLGAGASPFWPLHVALAVIAGFALGRLVYGLFSRALAETVPAGVQLSRRARLGRVFRDGMVRGVGFAFELGFGLALPILIFGQADHVMTVIVRVAELTLVIRLATTFFLLLLRPGASELRVIALEDGPAERLYRHLRLALLLTFIGAVPSMVLRELAIPPELGALAGILGIGITALAIGIALWANRKPLAAVFAEQGQTQAGFWASNWWLAPVAYFAFAWLTSSARLLLGLPDAVGLVGAPIMAAMLGVLVYGIGLFLADKYLPALSGEGAEAGAGADAATVGISAGRPWADRMALMLGGFAATFYLLDAWGIPLLRADGQIGFLGITALTIFLAYAAWTAIGSYFRRRIAEEIGEQGPASEDEGGASSVSRLGTLLPLFRNVILIAIFLVALMVILMQAGVDIAPLFAGAGIIGLAIGFGAQTLIRDIFSGLFFLVDDAFRVAEYIDTGGAKGTVERISIRSMQLRHQNGPLHTIPFGEIQQLTNFSRDWVIMKLPLRVTLDTDPERVRKLIKKLGQELLSDPLVGHKFIDPLKSQGVLSIDNYGIVIRIKFKTRPGDQFAARRVVYARIYDLFEREGIEFAGRDVRVRVNEGAGSERISPAVASAVAAELTQSAQGGGGDEPPPKP